MVVIMTLLPCCNENEIKTLWRLVSRDFRRVSGDFPLRNMSELKLWSVIYP